MAEHGNGSGLLSSSAAPPFPMGWKYTTSYDLSSPARLVSGTIPGIVASPEPGSGRIRFGSFEADPETGELRKHGIRIRLPEQSFRVLVALTARPNQLVTREELRQSIWSDDSLVDFEQGLNRAVNRVRDALSDTAANPRFIETLPGRGYRFIGQIEEPAPASAMATAKPARPVRTLVLGGIGVLAVVLMAANSFSSRPTVSLRWRKITTDNYIKFPPALSDGSRVYFRVAYDGEQFIAQVPVSGGQPSRLPATPPGPFFALQDLSPDGEDLLLTAAPVDYLRAMPLWSLRVADGAARRVGRVAATSARYSVDGSRIVWSTDSEIWTARKDGSAPHRVLQMNGSFLNSVFWSPDGSVIRFSAQNPLSSQTVVWEVRPEGGGLRRAPAEWSGASYTPSGWTPDGLIALFASDGDYWATVDRHFPFWRATSSPLKLTNGEPEFYAPVRPQNANDFYAIGIDRLGELERYDLATQRWVAMLDGLSAECVEYSPDRQRIAYISYPQNILWVRQADGSRPIQLTSQPMVAAIPRWSPDGKRLVFMGRSSPDKPMKAWIADPEVGSVEPAVPSDPGSQADPSWSPDGKYLTYALRGRTQTGEARYIRIVDMQTGGVSKFPGSEDLFAPRWAPDGSMLAALQSSGEHHLMLYRFAEKTWEQVSDLPADWPVWSADSKTIFFRSTNRIQRLRLRDRTIEDVADLKSEALGGFWHSLGLTPDGSPLRMRDRDSRQIYKLEFSRQ
jgi:DNA-binding winged helix-turn-helix (wHTH) protein/Tol biopolymer transport system component